MPFLSAADRPAGGTGHCRRLYHAVENDDPKTRREAPYRITLTKLRDLPNSAPRYQETFFNGLFKSKDKIRMDKLPASFARAYSRAESELQELFTDDMDFIDPTSRKAKKAGCLIGILVFLATSIGVSAFRITEDLISSLLGESVLCIFIILFCIKFMLRPSDYRVDMLGRLKGFRTFIKRAELDRIKLLVHDDPEYFYRILPYAYVFGLTNKWAKNFEMIAPETPVWFDGPAASFDVPDVFCSNITRPCGSDAARPAVKNTSFSIV